MKKTLIALAALGMVASTAQATNVTIYGKLQPSVDFISDAYFGDTTDMTWNNSRLGVKGSEDLGNGLSAIFQIESKVKLTEGGDAENAGGVDGIAGRDSWVGLKGDFGSITFGKHQTAYVKASAKYDFFADSIGDYNNIMGATPDYVSGFTSPAPALLLNERVAKSIYYKSPKMNGFQVQASYAMGNAHTDATPDTDIFAVAATYANGPLKVVAAYEKQKNRDYNSGFLPNGGEVTGYKIGAGYKLSIGTKINAIYENVDIDFDNLGGPSFDTNHFYLGASHPVTSAVDVMANFMYAGDMDIVGDDDGAKGYAIGAKYKFSKRTNIMAVYAVVDNDENAVYGIDSNGYMPQYIGGKLKGFSIRLQHNF